MAPRRGSQVQLALSAVSLVGGVILAVVLRNVLMAVVVSVVLGAPPARATAGPGVWCYPVRGRFGLLYGVAIAQGDQPPACFLSKANASILTALEQAGFDVSREERLLPGLFA